MLSLFILDSQGLEAEQDDEIVDLLGNSRPLTSELNSKKAIAGYVINLNVNLNTGDLTDSNKTATHETNSGKRLILEMNHFLDLVSILFSSDYNANKIVLAMIIKF